MLCELAWWGISLTLAGLRLVFRSHSKISRFDLPITDWSLWLEVVGGQHVPSFTCAPQLQRYYSTFIMGCGR